MDQRCTQSDQPGAGEASVSGAEAHPPCWLHAVRSGTPGSEASLAGGSCNRCLKCWLQSELVSAAGYPPDCPVHNPVISRLFLFLSRKIDRPPETVPPDNSGYN